MHDILETRKQVGSTSDEERRRPAMRGRRRLVLLAFWVAGCGAAAEPATEPVPEPVAAEPPGGTPEAGEPRAPAAEGAGTQLELTAEELAARLAAGERIALSTIAFESGGATLLPEGHPVLGQVVLVLRNDPALRLGIGVHSDGQGGGEFNLRITQERADAIREWLVGQGIAAERLEATGFGETHPVAPNSSAAGRRQNRRIEIFAL
jgi:outer membrane protein OmpA-like peptidoglycan-associated protein